MKRSKEISKETIRQCNRVLNTICGIIEKYPSKKATEAICDLMTDTFCAGNKIDFVKAVYTLMERLRDKPTVH